MSELLRRVKKYNAVTTDDARRAVPLCHGGKLYRSNTVREKEVEEDEEATACLTRHSPCGSSSSLVNRHREALVASKRIRIDHATILDYVNDSVF